MIVRRMLPVLLAAAVVLAAPPGSQSRERWLKVDTRPGVTVAVSLDAPKGSARGVVMALPDGRGVLAELRNNFPVRSSDYFVDAGYAVALVDTSSDRTSGMAPECLASAERLEDLRRVIGALDAQGLKPIFVIATSAGTVSLGKLAVAGDDRIAGVIFTSTLAAVSRYPLDRIRVPTLIVHHHDDGCHLSPFVGAIQIRSAIVNTPRLGFIEVAGGSPPRSGPCQALSPHGYLGLEKQVTQAIVDWMAGKEPPEKIGG